MCAERGIEKLCGIEEGTIFSFFVFYRTSKKIFINELFSVFYQHLIIMHAKRDNQDLAHLFSMKIKIITTLKTRRPIAPIIIYKWMFFSLFPIKKNSSNR